MQRLRWLVHRMTDSAQTNFAIQWRFAFANRIDEQSIVGQTFFHVLGDGGLAGRKDQNDVSTTRRLDVPRDAVTDATILRIDAHRAAFARLLVAVPAKRIDAARERIFSHKVEMIVVLCPVHVFDFEDEFQWRGGALQDDRIVARQRTASLVGSTTDSAAPKDFVHTKARLTAALIETGAAGRVERVDRQVGVFTFAGLSTLKKRTNERRNLH